MSREWKPGDVAMVRYVDSATWVPGICTTPYGNWRTREHGSTYQIAESRPLVVIDPVSITGPDETLDGDPLVEIANCLRRIGEGDHPSSYRRRVAERLAEVFDPTPPKPDEPTGLGAVVQDADGNLWVNSHRVTAWVNRDMQPRPYAEVDAVKVLSEGVTQ